MPTLGEWVEMIFCFTLILVYYSFFAFLTVTQPRKTSLGNNIAQQRRFIQHFLDTRRNEILAVQTLRNLIFSSSFFATSALLVSTGALTNFLLMEDGTSLSFRGTKVFILGMNFFFAFMAFLFCARWAGHLSCLMAVPPAPSSHQDREIQEVSFLHVDDHTLGESALRMMTFLSLSFAVGLRLMFLAVPLIFWVLGTPGLLLGTILLLVVQVATDALWAFQKG